MSLISFLEEDNPKGLFPLHMTVLYAKHGAPKLRTYIYDKLLSVAETDSFITAPVGYALKDSRHLRKLLLLDPVASFYIYDFVFRNADSFQVAPKSVRMQYGYAFKKSAPLPATDQYHAFRRRKHALKEQYPFFAKVDISNCFNSFYHHDIVRFLGEATSDVEARQAGQFLREINSGTSINCFPQGIYPAKTLV